MMKPGPVPASYAVRDAVFEVVAAGRSLAAGASLVGVSKQTAWRWWQESAPMGLDLVRSSRGGTTPLAPVAPAAPVAPVAPAPRVAPAVDDGALRKRRVLSSEDRAVIAACLRRSQQPGAQPITLQQIGDLIGRSRSVVSREIARNRGADGSYHAPLAHLAARHRRARPKPFRLIENPDLRRRIEGWMDQGWSPKLIATVLKTDHPHVIMDRVSHETIYQALYVQGRGSLRQDLHRQLSTHRPRRQARGARQTKRTSAYREAYKISQRPAEVADRAVPGNWEGDLVLGTKSKSAVGVLVERSTRFTILLHLPATHDAETVAAAMIAEMSELPEHLRLSLTWDRGGEMARYDKIQLALNMPVYFCDPHSPWQRGTGENTNRLLRHWLPKGTDLSTHTRADLRRYAASLNARPRPTLDMKTPAQALDQLLSNPQQPHVA